MHPAIIIGTVRSLIVDVAMGQIPRSTERISSYYYFASDFTAMFLSHVTVLSSAECSLRKPSLAGVVSVGHHLWLTTLTFVQ